MKAEHTYKGELPDNQNKLPFPAYGVGQKATDVLSLPDPASLAITAANIWAKHRLRIKAHGKWVPVEGQPDEPDFSKFSLQALRDQLEILGKVTLANGSKPVFYKDKFYSSIQAACKGTGLGFRRITAELKTGENGFRFATDEEIKKHLQ